MTRDLTILGLAMLLWGVGEGMFTNLLTLHIRELGATHVQLGVILSLVGIAMTVVHLPAGYLADKWGPRRIMWMAWILGLTSGWVMALASRLEFFVIGFIMYGFTSFVSAPMSKYIIAAATRWSAGRALSTIIAMYNAGAIAGPILGGYVAERWGLRSVFFVAACIFIISAGLVFFIRYQPVLTMEAQPGGVASNPLRTPLFYRIAILLFAGMIIAYLPQPLSPNYLQEMHKLTYAEIGTLAAIGNLGSVILLLLIGRLHPRLGFILAQGSVLIFSALLWLGTGIPLFTVGYFFLGGYRVSRSMASVLIRSMAGERQAGLAFGIMETLIASGVIFAPMLASFLFSIDPRWMYVVSLVLGVVSILVNLRLLPDKRDADRPSAAVIST